MLRPILHVEIVPLHNNTHLDYHVEVIAIIWEIGALHTCLNVSLAIASLRTFRSFSYIIRAFGSCDFFVTDLRIVPSTAPSSREELAP